MAISVLFNGVVYSIPETGEESWGENLTSYFTAIPQGALQKTGGNFTLTADVNFGANFGILSKYFTTRSSNPSTAGINRLAVGDSIGWRNNANSANLLLGVNGSDQLTFNGGTIPTGGITQLTGDVTAVGPGSVVATVAFVGSYSAANVAAGATLANAAVSANTASAIVRRDSSGNFVAGTITASLTGHASLDVATSSLGTVTEATSAVLTLTGWSNATVGSPTIQVKLASTSQAGYLSATDWNTFNGKQAAGSYITALTGDITASGPGSVAATLATVNSNVGSFAIATVTVNAKGLVTAASAATTTGSGNVVLATSPTLVTPALGTPSALVGTNITGTASGLTAGNVTTNANLTGVITSVGNATSIASQTGTGTKFVVDTSPTLVTPVLGVASATTLSMSGAINMNSHQINSVTDPTSAQDAATKAYVDSVASGLAPKQACYAGSTVNIAGTYVNGVAGVGATFTITATGALSIDGVSPPINSRILIKNQSTGFQNGVYDLTVVGTTGVSPVLTRSLNYNTAADIDAGDLLPIINGTINGSTIWLQTATITTVGTDALVFVQFTVGPNGTVTSVTFTGDGVILSSTPSSPVTTTGTLTASLRTQTAGTFLKGPNSGNAATPTFAALQSPTVQKFTAAASGATNYAFTITSGNTASVGAVYTNNGQSFTLIAALLVGDTILYCSGTGTPAASGTLTYSSGTHTGGNITFSAFNGAYALPAGTLYLEVEMVGGGGGGGGGGNSGGVGGTGGTGGNTTFGTSLLVANGGAGGGPQVGGTGGTASLGSGPIGTALSGGIGQGGGFQPGSYIYMGGGMGATSPFGGTAGGPAGGGGAGRAAASNTGSGGSGGASANNANDEGGAGGGSGGYIDAIITSPSAFYPYAIGAAGTTGSAGTNGSIGGLGGSGYIIIIEKYQ